MLPLLLRNTVSVALPGMLDEDNQNTATVSVNGDIYNIEVRPDGGLSSVFVPGVEVAMASVEFHRHVTCFFGRRSTAELNVPNAVSVPFSTTLGFSEPFYYALRLYCYDSSRNQEHDDTFTIFVQNRAMEEELVQVTLPEQAARPGTLDLAQNYPDLSRDVEVVALVGTPGMRDVMGKELMIPWAFCMAYSSARGNKGVFDVSNPMLLREARDFNRIECLKADTFDEANRNMLMLYSSS